MNSVKLRFNVSDELKMMFRGKLYKSLVTNGL